MSEATNSTPEQHTYRPGPVVNSDLCECGLPMFHSAHTFPTSNDHSKRLKRIAADLQTSLTSHERKDILAAAAALEIHPVASQLENVAKWLENNCDPYHAARELRLMADKQRAAPELQPTSNERISEDRLRNTRAWAAARVGQLSGADVIVGAIDELLQMREDWKTICEAAEAMPAPEPQPASKELERLIRRMNELIPSSVTPATRVEVHPCDLISLIEAATASETKGSLVLRICTAYEQGYGQARRSISNPYQFGTQESVAWACGRTCGGTRE